LRVTLRDVAPKVVRVIDVPASRTLPELHDLRQAAVGWTDSHLHQFVAGELTYGVPAEDADPEQRDGTGARLKDLPARFVYLYDFGDGWEHDVEILGPSAERPGCPYGKGICLPEDVGGPSGHVGAILYAPGPQASATTGQSRAPNAYAAVSHATGLHRRGLSAR
jgi:hypothetical protein